MRAGARSLYRSVSQFHEDPRLVALAATPAGSALLWAAAALLLAASGWWRFLPLVPLMVLAQRFPERRPLILSVGGSGWFLYRQLGDAGVDAIPGRIVASLFVVGALYLCFRVAKAFRRLPRVVRRSPQLSLHLALWCLIAPILLLPQGESAATGVAAGSYAAVVGVLGFTVWRVGYMFSSARRGSIGSTGFASHLFYCLPGFGGSHTPFGKGYDYLTAKRADAPEALARSRLAGLKLLVLACLWSVAVRLLAPALAAGGAPARSLALGSAWVRLFAEMVLDTLGLAVRGHVIVGCLRLFGFNVFRNTYKPLIAVSIVDFWNRYYYYFKELLVEFFFFPTYVTYFKGSPRLRTFAATMAAAFVGNSYYHLLQRVDESGGARVAESVPELASYLFYSFLLGIGVFVSMLREQGRRGQPVPSHSPALARLVTLRKIAGVWLFFSLIRIWDAPDRSFWQNTERFLALFGASSGSFGVHG